MSEQALVLIEERGHAGLITLNRPKALNALNLPMVRAITAALLRWRDTPDIRLVAIRGMGKAANDSAANSAAPVFEPFGAFCAGGDIRFFHQAARAGDPTLEDFFTEEYRLNHLIHTYPKAYVAFLDGIVMGGGMGLCQGRALAAPASGEHGEYTGGVLRIVTERSKMAMPETNIGLFPDVGGGWFLGRCMQAAPGMGEYLALTGQVLAAPDAIAVGLADMQIEAAQLPALWARLPDLAQQARTGVELIGQIATEFIAKQADSMSAIVQNRSKIETTFGSGGMGDILARLQADDSDWARQTAEGLRKRSPLMLHVTLELVRRARHMRIADDLRLERDLVRHCFDTRHLQRSSAASETVEGIRALAVDKDHTPIWQPARIEDVTDAMVAPFFSSPWPIDAHPLAHLPG